MSSTHEKATAPVGRVPVSSDEESPNHGTKEKILLSAERLFANEGFDTVSLRNITEKAGVNLAAVNYHYGSKEALILAVLKSRILPLNVERVRLLKDAAAASEGKPLKVETIARAYIGPVLRAVGETSHSDASLAHLIARFLGDQSDRMQEMVVEQFPELAQTFVHQICLSIAHLSPSDALLRLLFMEGALVHALLYYDRLHALVEGGFETPAIEELESQLLPFVIEGLTAPLPSPHE